MKTRLKILGLVFSLASISILIRLFFWQIIKGGELASYARRQYKSEQTLSAERGSILASDNTWLAANQTGFLVYALKPDLTNNPKIIANKLAPLMVDNLEDKDTLLKETQRIEELLSKKNLRWIPLKHKISKDVKKNIEDLGIDGINFETEEIRMYPEGSIAAQLLGFVGKNEIGEDIGYFGLEGYYDLPLKGKPGFLESENDARGFPILAGDANEISAIGGVNLVTHIDKTIQLIVEKKLKEAVEKYGAKSGSVAVMVPSTGAIMGMASYPTYEPVKYFDYGNEFFKNPVISDSFEPGSIFKPLVMAAAIDDGVVNLDTICDICSGPIKVDKFVIETWDKKYFPNSNLTDIIIHSDNVGMIFVGKRLGSDHFFDYLQRFGIGSLTNVDLQGETNPRLREKGKWNVVDLATASFGQGVAVTPIQILKAFSGIANRGKVVKPTVVNKIIKDGWEQKINRDLPKSVVSEETAQVVTQMMVEAVRNGESKWTSNGGFSVAGKTGTAQIPVSGHYDSEKTVASFIGFAPAQEAKFLMLVTLREPTSSPWGSETAAPLWFSIANEIFPYLGIQPDH